MFLFYRYNTETMRFENDDNKQTNMSFNPRVFSVFLIQLIPLLVTTGLLIPLMWKLCTHSSIER